MSFAEMYYDRPICVLSFGNPPNVLRFKLVDFRSDDIRTPQNLWFVGYVFRVQFLKTKINS